MKLFLDANVLFTAAHNTRGKASLILELGRQGAWTLATSRYAAEEARRNLQKKLPEAVDNLTALLRGVELAPHRSEAAFPPALVEKDRPIFQAAVACGASHLLTGDLKDFGRFMDRPDETFDIVVQTVARFLDSVMEAGGVSGSPGTAQRRHPTETNSRRPRGSVERGS